MHYLIVNRDFFSLESKMYSVIYYNFLFQCLYCVKVLGILQEKIMENYYCSILYFSYKKIYSYYFIISFDFSYLTPHTLNLLFFNSFILMVIPVPQKSDFYLNAL